MRYLFLLLVWVSPFTTWSVLGQKLAPTSLSVPDSLRRGSTTVLEYTTDYQVLDRSSAVISSRRVITLHDANHDDDNVLRVFYSKDSKITKLDAASFDFLGQQIDRAKSSDIVDRKAYSQVTFYDDNRYQEVTVPCPSYPCTVVYEVEQRVSNMDFVGSLQRWVPQQREQALIHAALNISLPLDNELLYSPHQLDEPMVTVDSKQRSYHWEIRHQSAQEREPYAPPAAATLPYLRLGLADFEIEGYRGSFRSWEAFGQFMQTIMQGRDQLPPRLEQEVKETVAGLDDERQKIDRLYRFMQQRMRYVGIQLGIGGWQPFSAEYVEQNRFGDCKALSNYMGAILQTVDIASYPVLIDWDDKQDYPVTQSFTTPAFNHMVLYVPRQDMYLECTSHDAPMGYLGEGKQDRNVLWITPTGGELHRTPALEPTENGYTRTVDVTIAADGTTQIALRSTHYGGSQELFRNLVDQLPSRKDQLDWLHRYDYLPDVSGNDYVLRVDLASPRASLHYTTTVNNYVRKLGTRMFVPINGYFDYDDVPPADADRTLPIQTTTTRFFVDTINLHLPEGMEVESGLFSEPIQYDHLSGEYAARMQATDDGVQWIRTFKLLPVDLPREAYADFRQFFLDVARSDDVQLVLREKRTK